MLQPKYRKCSKKKFYFYRTLDYLKFSTNILKKKTV